MRVKRRIVEDALIILGEAQMKYGITHPRTEFCVHTFKEWKSADI